MRPKMILLTRALLPTVVLILVSARAAGSAKADGPVDCAVHPNDPACTITVSDPGGGGQVGQPVGTGNPGSACVPPSGPGIPAGVDCNGCIWSAWSPGPGLQDVPAYQQWLAAGGKGSLSQEACYPGPTTAVVYFPPGAAPPPPGVSASQLGAEAVAMLPLPAMVTASAPGAAGRPFAQTFVNFPTFLWVDGAQWHPYTATANDGFKAVTATAAPSSVTWAMGDGHATTCAGPGVPWRPGVDQSYCSYTYATSSVHQAQVSSDVNNRPYPVSVVVTYQVTWTCAGQCGGVAGGTVGPVNGPVSQMPLVVGEIQTVVTG